MFTCRHTHLDILALKPYALLHLCAPDNRRACSVSNKLNDDNTYIICNVYMQTYSFRHTCT